MDIAPNQGAADNRIWLRFCGRRAHLSSHHHNQWPRLELDIKNGWSVVRLALRDARATAGQNDQPGGWIGLFRVGQSNDEEGKRKVETPRVRNYYLPVLVVRRCCLMREPKVPSIFVSVPPRSRATAAIICCRCSELGYFPHPAISRVDHEYQPGGCCYFGRRQTSILHC